MFRLPLTKIAMMDMPALAPQAPAPMPTPPPPPPPPPPPGIAGNGGGGTKSKSDPVNAAPGAPKAFKISRFKVALYPPIQPTAPRAGLGTALADTGAEYLDGLGHYSLDVLNENNRRTQRPNDPRVMHRNIQ